MENQKIARLLKMACFLILGLGAVVLGMQLRLPASDATIEGTAGIEKIAVESYDKLGYGIIISYVKQDPNNTHLAIVSAGGHRHFCIMEKDAKVGQWVKVSKSSYLNEDTFPLFFATPIPTREDAKKE